MREMRPLPKSFTRNPPWNRLHIAWHITASRRSSITMPACEVIYQQLSFSPCLMFPFLSKTYVWKRYFLFASLSSFNPPWPLSCSHVRETCSRWLVKKKKKDKKNKLKILKGSSFIRYAWDEKFKIRFNLKIHQQTILAWPKKKVVF